MLLLLFGVGVGVVGVVGAGVGVVGAGVGFSGVGVGVMLLSLTPFRRETLNICILFGGWGRTKLKLTTLPRILIVHVVCQINSIVFAIQR